MTFFTTPELLEIGGMPFTSPNQKPTRARPSSTTARSRATPTNSTCRQYHTVDSQSDRLRRRLYHSVCTDRFDRPQTFKRPQAHHRHRLLRPPQLPPHPRRRPLQSPSLLQRGPPLRRPRRSSSLEAKIPPPLRPSTSGVTARKVTLVHRGAEHSPPHQILDQARHRKPHQEWRNQAALLLNSTVTADHRRLRHCLATPFRPRHHPQRLRFRPHRLPSRTSPSSSALASTSTPNNDRCPIHNPATLESNVPGIYVAGVIVAGERTNEDLHRKRPLPRQAHRRFTALEAARQHARLAASTSP